MKVFGKQVKQVKMATVRITTTVGCTVRGVQVVSYLGPGLALQDGGLMT